MHYGVISLLGLDTEEDSLYGVSLNGKAVVKSSKDHAAKFVGIPVTIWEEVKAKGTTIPAFHIGRNEFAITDDSLTPSNTIGSSNWGGEESIMAEIFVKA